MVRKHPLYFALSFQEKNYMRGKNAGAAAAERSSGLDQNVSVRRLWQIIHTCLDTHILMKWDIASIGGQQYK